jgi:hypothetical protein
MIKIHLIPAGNRHSVRRISQRHASQAARVAIRLILLLPFSAAAPAADSVAVRLEGYIPPFCQTEWLTAPIALEIDDLLSAGSRQIDFTLTCNTPFSYRVEAQHGALINTETAVVSGGFSAAVPYEVVMYIPTDGSAIDDVCPGDSLRASAPTCSFTNAGGAIATNAEGKVTVTWTPPSMPLLAGEYHDRLTLTFGSQL